MGQRGIRGSSYRMLYNYLEGKALPSAKFIAAAADVLGVSPDWLRTGRGPRHRIDAQYPADRPDAPEEPFETLRQDLTGICPTLRRLPRVAQILFVDTVVKYARGAADADRLTTSLAASAPLYELAMDLDWMLGIVLGLRRRAWGFRFRYDTDADEVGECAVALLHAVRLALPKAGTGDPLQRHRHSLIPQLREKSRIPKPKIDLKELLSTQPKEENDEAT